MFDRRQDGLIVKCRTCWWTGVTPESPCATRPVQGLLVLEKIQSFLHVMEAPEPSRTTPVRMWPAPPTAHEECSWRRLWCFQSDGWWSGLSPE